MCGPRKKERGCYCATGSLFSVNPASIPMQEKKNASGLTPSELDAILANSTKVSEEEKISPHEDRGYYSP